MADKMTYEAAIKRLEEIAQQLEGGALSLEESMRLFEEGTKLTAFCTRQLDEAEQKITELAEE